MCKAKFPVCLTENWTYVYLVFYVISSDCIAYRPFSDSCAIPHRPLPFIQLSHHPFICYFAFQYSKFMHYYRALDRPVNESDTHFMYTKLTELGRYTGVFKVLYCFRYCCRLKLHKKFIYIS